MDKKYVDLVDAIIKGSLNKKVEWETTSNEDEFLARFASSSLTISKSVSVMGVLYTELTIYNKEGEEMDNIFYSEENEPQNYRALELLHSTARAAYFNIDETINNIINELKDNT